VRIADMLGFYRLNHGLVRTVDVRDAQLVQTEADSLRTKALMAFSGLRSDVLA
jgi:hypothetical protein